MAPSSTRQASSTARRGLARSKEVFAPILGIVESRMAVAVRASTVSTETLLILFFGERGISLPPPGVVRGAHRGWLNYPAFDWNCGQHLAPNSLT